MAENLFISSHKASTKEFREGWERTFRNPNNSLYCTVEAHQNLYRQGIKSCPKCGASTSTQLAVHVEGESNETY